MVFHLLCSLAAIQRSPAPQSTFHQFDQQQLRYPFIFRQLRKGVGSPIEDLVPRELQNTEEWSWHQDVEIYKNSLPLYLMIPSVVPTVLGISLWTVRIGNIVTLLIASFLLFEVTRKMASRTSGLVAVFFFTMNPAVWQSILIPAPFLSIMMGVLLCLWTLWNSQFGARPLWMALSGIAFGILPLFGETAGDAIPPTLVVFPMLVLYLCAVMWTRGWKGAVAIVSLLVPVWLLFPVEWLSHQMERYIWSEAQATAGETSLVDGMYGEVFNLGQSLMMPSIFALVLWSIWGIRKRTWQALWLLSGVVVLFGSAVWSHKSYDYYLSAMIPVLMIVVGVHFTKDWKQYAYGLCAVISAGTWLTLRHWDSPTVRTSVPSVFLQDRGLGQWQASPLRMFRHWRQAGGMSQPRRDRMAGWLLNDEGRQLLDGLQTEALVLVFDSPESDVIHYIGSIVRQDVLFHRTALGYSQPITQQLRQHHDHVYVMMSNSVQRPCALEGGLILKRSIRKAEDVCIWEIEG